MGLIANSEVTALKNKIELAKACLDDEMKNIEVRLDIDELDLILLGLSYLGRNKD